MADVSTDPFESGLPRDQANYVPLSPLSLLRRAADVYPDYPSSVYAEMRFSWAETYARCRRLASALSQRGVRKGEVVAVMAPNVPALLEAHFGIPMVGAVLNAINTRLDPETVSYILEHGAAKVFIVDRELSAVAAEALRNITNPPLVVDIDDSLGENGERIGELDYEAFLTEGNPEFDWRLPEDEWQAIALNYTSGTTGKPKGVVYHHRGAYLNALGNVLAWSMPWNPVYLWTLPMFHCNGWCFPWAVTAMAGTHVCLRRVEPRGIFQAIQSEGVTHFSAAPVVLNMMVNAPEEVKVRVTDRVVQASTGGAAPPAAIIEAMENLGINVTHLYGLTETYGPSVGCVWRSEWDELPLQKRGELKARIGVRNPLLEGLMVADAGTMEPVPADGRTIGEIFLKGNSIMKGYLKNTDATKRAFEGGWFHSGDLGVMHPDGYVQIKDRLKDIVISGGENISSIEVESVLYRHPAVAEAAVVAKPDPKWGETPCAFVTLKEGAAATEGELIAFCRQHMAHFKVPHTIVFADLPKTSTGKVQKYLLREQARALAENQ